MAALRADGHVIKSVGFYGDRHWVWCLVENGRYCGVHGDKGKDSDAKG